jgi:hypothetical protein
MRSVRHRELHTLDVVERELCAFYDDLDELLADTRVRISFGAWCQVKADQPMRYQPYRAMFDWNARHLVIVNKHGCRITLLPDLT